MKYKFSIIIAIYNMEEYLEECLESIINQTLDFKENTQLILVNDGSIDNSEKIIDKYIEIYPENIIAITKQNGGVSSARNEGLKHTEGKYINFLDADDKLALDVLEKVNCFFDENIDELKVVSIPLYFFDAIEGEHALNYKFKETRVINLEQDYENVQMSCSSSFIKREEIIDLKFDTSLKYGEDAKLLNNILQYNPYLGVISDAEYYYRKRPIKNSAVDQAAVDTYFYKEYIDNFHLKIIEESYENLGRIPLFTQYAILYALQWHFPNSWKDIPFTEKEECEKYLKKLKNILAHINIQIITTLMHLPLRKKLEMINLKTGIKNKVVHLDGQYSISLNGTSYDLTKMLYNVRVFSAKNNILKIEIAYDDFGDVNTCLKINNKVILPVKDEYYKTERVLDEKIYDIKYAIFQAEMKDFKENGRIEFYLFEKDREIEIKNLTFGKFNLLNNVNNSKYHNGDILFSVMKNKLYNYITFKKYSLNRYRIREYISAYRKKREMGVEWFKIQLAGIFKPKKKIWLISDRVNSARDNGESLFKYLINNKEKYKEIEPYFLLNKDSVDYNRLSLIGNVLENGSLEHKKMFVKADKIISSHAEDYIFNPFAKDRKQYARWFNFDFVFLQHGVIIHDLSKWLSRVNKNISMFTTSAYGEYKSIVEGHNFYDENEVKLIGLCRFDNLVDNRQRKITVFPTWRPRLVVGYDNESGEWKGRDDLFLKSDYYQFFSDFLNDENLNNILEEKNITLEFVLHPNLSCYTHLFESKGNVKVNTESIDYSRIMSESACLITDYSSIVYDFVYMAKPIIYAQFDIETVYDNATYDKGYFDFERDGFGPVCKYKEELITEVKKAIDSNFEMENKYLDRKQNFFKYNDSNNCARTVSAILNEGNEYRK